jgi:hypothetical protein
VGRIRTIKPDFHKNEALSALPAEAHLLASGLLCYADDEGYFDANPKLVQAEVFPLRELTLKIEELMAMLIKCKYITVTSHNGKRIGHVVTFTTHQRVNRPSPSRLKPHGVITEDSPTEGKGKEEEKEGKGTEVITPEMITRGVLSETGLAGRDLAVVLEEVCRSHVKLYESPGALRDALIESWRQYDVSRPSLAYTTGAAKFYGEGAWKNKAGWPWKPGAQPNEVKPTTAAEKMRRQA